MLSCQYLLACGAIYAASPNIVVDKDDVFLNARLHIVVVTVLGGS